MIHWLILVSALTEDQTHNFDVSGKCYNQLSYLVRAKYLLQYPLLWGSCEQNCLCEAH